MNHELKDVNVRNLLMLGGALCGLTIGGLLSMGLLFGYWMYYRWVHLPAYMALLFWILLQFVLVVEQQMGIGNVAALAHLGGAAAGVVAWLLWGAKSATA